MSRPPVRLHQEGEGKETSTVVQWEEKEGGRRREKVGEVWLVVRGREGQE